MKHQFLLYSLFIFAESASANLIFTDDFNAYTNGVSIAGADWQPKWDAIDTTQQDLLTGHSDGYAVLDTSVAKSNYHAPTSHGFIVGSSGGSAVIKADFRYDHTAGGDITEIPNKAAFGLLVSTTANWDSGTNSGIAMANRGGAIGNTLPVDPWIEGWVTHSSLGIDTNSGGSGSWITIELTLTDINGVLWAQATITNKATDTLLYTTTSFSTNIASSETLFAGITTHWNDVGTSIVSFSKMEEVHIDNFSVEVFSKPIDVTISPEISASIGGVLDFDRSQFISISSEGEKFESTINDQSQVSYYVDTLGMNFGRELGGVYTVTRYNSSTIREDPARPGYVDIDYFASRVNASNGNASQAFQNKFSPNLNSATHDRQDAYPSFMEMWYDGSSGNHGYPTNVDAASEFAAAVLEYGYTDWTRPTTYEIVNEPNYRIWDDQRFADLHTAVQARVDAAELDVAVGGPCLAVSYYYKNNYQQFGLKNFIDNTSCTLDFYSFHTYDFMHWDVSANDFEGRVSSGLPIEGVLDLIQNYTVNQYGKEVDIVLSEHGGYILNDQEGALDTVANTYFPGSGFDWELKRRSVNEFLAVSSAIGNTLAFMNNPHVVRKAVPFILLESAAWDPYYYSTLLVKENFNPSSNIWHESKYINFYKFFQNVNGRRVHVQLSDPDIQCQAYVDGDKLYILLNNLARKTEALNLTTTTDNIDQITLRRFGRNADFTPYFNESTIDSLDGLVIASRESLAIEIDYALPIAQQTLVDETPHYGNLIQQSYNGSKTFNISIPEYSAAQYATLRIGVGRGTGTDHQLDVTFNGTPLTVPLEDCADYLENDSEYASTKLIDIPVNLLSASNTVEVSFSENGYGGIGSVVIRAAIDNTVNQVPQVDAGADLNLETPNNTFILNGSVLDDALPENADVTNLWTQVSGPLPAEIASPDTASTQVTCYFEGTYVFRLTADDTQYQVSDDVTVTISEPLAVEVQTLQPIEDAYIQGSSTVNSSELRARNDSILRTSFIKFQIPPMNGTLTAADLKMTVTNDLGYGTMRSYIGSNNDWTESSLTSSNAPSQIAEADTFTGLLYNVQSFDLSEHITEDSYLTVILSLDSGGNDVAYGSSESVAPPTLELTTTKPAVSNDLDGDGMLDSWEKTHFGSILFSDGALNQDLDLYTDNDEYIAGTDPNDPHSFLHLRLSNDNLNNGQMTLEWDPVAGRTYEILWSPSLTSTPFQVLASGLAAPQSSYTDTLLSTHPIRFYKIQVQSD